MRLAKYLGQNASCLLEAEPFKSWPVERGVDDDSDPPEVQYVFVDCGLEFNCNRDDEKIMCIFLKSETHLGSLISEVPLHLRREDVLAHYGSPSKSGGPITHPILGKFGPWDRFDGPEYTIHFQYKVCSNSIEMITLMRNDVAP